jgi:hypothetical protein
MFVKMKELSSLLNSHLFCLYLTYGLIFHLCNGTLHVFFLLRPDICYEINELMSF